MGGVFASAPQVGYGPPPNAGVVGNPNHRKQLAENELMAVAIHGINHDNRYTAISALEDIEYYLNIVHDHTPWDVFIRYDNPDTALRDRIMFALERTALDTPYPNGVIARYKSRCRRKGFTPTDFVMNVLFSGLIASVIAIFFAYAYKVITG